MTGRLARRHHADVGLSSPLERPGLARLLADARWGGFDVGVVERRETITSDPAAAIGSASGWGWFVST
ncbi:MAG: hypothetical protein M0Z95_05180 [Actinomycetota bacterium]|nr:hypothetical protein [Actinomycetota bacterium]